MFTIEDRPQRVSELCGNKDFKTYYKNSFKTKDFSFPSVSMLLSNTPGLGKSTLAKIIAKMLNCKEPVFNEKEGYYEPCDNCLSCKDIIDEKYNRDVHLYSGATDRTEDLLKIGDILKYPASYEKNTIVLIEEFQNIHASGLSSLLLICENPRPNTFFVFCSMSADKKSKEITALKSRSQRFMLYPPSTDDISEYIINLLDSKKLLDNLPETFFTEVIPALATFQDEGMRGIVANVERCILSELYTEKEVIKELGIISENTVFNLMDRLISKDKNVIHDISALSDLNSFYEMSKSMFFKAIAFKVSNPENETGGWKKYSKNNNLDKLLDCYVETMRLPYFQPNVFIYYLSKFLLEDNSKVLKETNQQPNIVPVRQPVRRPV